MPSATIDPDAVPPPLDRRALLRLAAAAAASAVGSAPASAQSFAATAIQSALGEGQRFSAATLVDLARVLSRRPYTPPGSDLPDPFGALTYEQYIAIRATPGAVLWNFEGRGFTVEPLHRGFGLIQRERDRRSEPVRRRGRRRAPCRL